ncbi:MAG: hypothetical protein K2H86_00335 [Muribaculaceae bacterium]|nr:hypothetical protein [Muribaculaceae bacterium]
MTIKDAILPYMIDGKPDRIVNATTPLIEALPLLLDTPDRIIGVGDGDKLLGVVTQSSMLQALGSLIVPRDDSSVITVTCPADRYAASTIAHAVEDAGAHLVDLFSGPDFTDGIYPDNLRVTLRVRTLNPGHVMQSLERYGYQVVEAGQHTSPDAEIFAERLASLNALLNV